MGKYFGTDGIRGMANNGKLNTLFVGKLGYALGNVFAKGKPNHKDRVIIGKDPRNSGYMIENALSSGLNGTGMRVLRTGPLSTPAIAYLTESMRCDLGIMISASHNPSQDNGIKIFGPDGFKLSKELEARIEALIDEPDLPLATPDRIGGVVQVDRVPDRYVEIVKRALPKDMRFGGMRVVIDCANGAAYEVAPQALQELDVDVIPIGVDPDGFNINHKCGSTAPEALIAKVRESRADLGIALDGDADRAVLVDENGALLNGDQILSVIATNWKKAKMLSKPVVVGTVMSNLGLEHYLKKLRIKFERTDVGDQHILQRLRDEGYNLGGEESGHIICSDFAKTGDGLLAALQVMKAIKESGARASQVCHLYKPTPQITKNVPFNAKLGNPLESRKVKASIAKAQKILGANGRLLVRKSGTEPVIRVTAQGADKDKISALVDDMMSIIRKN